MIYNDLQQKLFFIIGKGGVGRSTISASMASYFSQKKEKVLVVQWALSDSISPIFKYPQVGHSEETVAYCFLPHKEHIQFKTMNFDPDEAIKEYFVDHLKMKLLYSIIIQNKHVQKLIHAAPGISELFFLGRLFWLVELAQQEKGIFYDRIIVDTPATGHGVSLFGIAKAVANLGITGPLAAECERVSRLLSDEKKTAVIIVTLPEELPMEECMESVPKVVEKLGFVPSLLFINQSISENIYPALSVDFEENGCEDLLKKLNSENAKTEFKNLILSLMKRNFFEKKLQDFANSYGIRLVSIPDFNLTEKKISPFHVIESITHFCPQERL